MYIHARTCIFHKILDKWHRIISIVVLTHLNIHSLSFLKLGLRENQFIEVVSLANATQSPVQCDVTTENMKEKINKCCKKINNAYVYRFTVGKTSHASTYV